MFLEISWGLRAGNWPAGRQTRLWQAKKAFDLVAGRSNSTAYGKQSPLGRVHSDRSESLEEA
jgi:hypothetical protein